MPIYYFLPEDLMALNKKIAKMQEALEKALGEIGESQQGESNSWHDNFAYEEGQREATLCSTRIRELVRIRNCAQVITSLPNGNIVAIGSVVTIRDMATNHRESFKIGSFWIMESDDEEDSSGPDKVSYSAPLAQMILGAKAGEIRDGKIGDVKKRLEVISISQ